MGIFNIYKSTKGILPLGMVLLKMPHSWMIIIILNLTVIVVSRSCTQKKTNLRQKYRMFKIKAYPNTKNFTQACLLCLWQIPGLPMMWPKAPKKHPITSRGFSDIRRTPKTVQKIEKQGFQISENSSIQITT